MSTDDNIVAAPSVWCGRDRPFTWQAGPLEALEADLTQRIEAHAGWQAKATVLWSMPGVGPVLWEVPIA